MNCRSGSLLGFLVLFFCLTASGCIRGTRPALELTYLDIDPGSPSQVPQVSTDVLLLRRLDVDSRFEDRNFFYRTGAATYESDYYVRFVASPADLVTERLEAWLTGSGLFKTVVEPRSSIEHRYILEGEISELYGDYTNPQQPAAVIKAEFALVDDLEGMGKIVFKKQYRFAERLSSNGAQSLASAWGAALKKLFIELTSDISRSFQSP